jgi:hypothetical protein
MKKPTYTEIKTFLLEYDKKYWVMMSIILIFHGIAAICTWIALSNKSHQECNPAAKIVIDMIGVAPALILSEIMLFAAMVYMTSPHRKHVSKIMFAAYIIMILVCGFDAFNDVSVLWHLGYEQTTHAVISGTADALHVKLTCGV